MEKKKRKALNLTEKTNPLSRRIDTASPLEIVRTMNREDRKIAGAVQTQLKPIARAVRLGAEALSRGGRLFHVGAGTSDRLGVPDAAECPPTFSVSSTQVQGIIAGGRRALWRSEEAAEGNPSAGALALRRAKVPGRDVVCGISASGQTPFVQGALAEATNVPNATGARRPTILGKIILCMRNPESGIKTRKQGNQEIRIQEKGNRIRNPVQYSTTHD